MASLASLCIKVAGIETGQHRNKNKAKNGEDIDEEDCVVMWHAFGARWVGAWWVTGKTCVPVQTHQSSVANPLVKRESDSQGTFTSKLV